MRKMNMDNMVRKYCLTITDDRKTQLEQKAVAEKIFKGLKSSYSARVPQLFTDYSTGK